MNTEMLGLVDFVNKGRNINLGIFKDLEKAIDVDTFRSQYKGRGVLTAQGLEKFVTEIHNQATELSKGGQSVVSLIEKANSDLKGLEVVKVLTPNGVVSMYVMPPDQNLEKGMLGDAIGYPSDKTAMSFTKTGKEIKEKISTIMNAITTKLAEAKSQMVALLEKCDCMPTSGWEEYERVPLGCEEIKTFPYEKCYYSADRNGGATYGISTDVKAAAGAKSEEEAKNCRDYNALVRKVCDMTKDKNYAEAMVRNMDDKKTFELSVAQLTSLGF